MSNPGRKQTESERAFLRMEGFKRVQIVTEVETISTKKGHDGK